MRKVDRNALVPFSAAQMFALVDDVPQYRGFLPWCQDSREVSRSDDEVVASLRVGFEALNTEFTTRNRLDPYSTITMTLENGPFRELRGQWTFEPVGEAGCQVGLTMQFEFANAAQDLLLGASFEKICTELIDAFIKHAYATLEKSDHDRR
jgi:ribosome-associated toxin RatA of RatAB toxin-antitoxin module